MARLDIEPSKDQLFSELNDEHKSTITKALEIQDILINNPPSDKRFNKHSITYILDYIEILNAVQNDDYNDKNIQRRINSLYNKVFKNRRY